MAYNLSFTWSLNKCLLPWSGWIILSRLNAIKEFATSFLSFELTCCKFIKENTLTHSFLNYYRKRIKHPPGFSYGEIRCPNKGGILGGLQKVSPFCWLWPLPKKWVPLSPDHRPYIGKKVSLIAFRQILLNSLPEAWIFSNTIMTYQKARWN